MLNYAFHFSPRFIQLYTENPSACDNALQPHLLDWDRVRQSESAFFGRLNNTLLDTFLRTTTPSLGRSFEDWGLSKRENHSSHASTALLSTALDHGPIVSADPNHHHHHHDQKMGQKSRKRQGEKHKANKIHDSSLTHLQTLELRDQFQGTPTFIRSSTLPHHKHQPQLQTPLWQEGLVDLTSSCSIPAQKRRRRKKDETDAKTGGDLTLSAKLLHLTSKVMGHGSALQRQLNKAPTLSSSASISLSSSSSSHFGADLWSSGLASCSSPGFPQLCDTSLLVPPCSSSSSSSALSLFPSSPATSSSFSSSSSSLSSHATHQHLFENYPPSTALASNGLLSSSSQGIQSAPGGMGLTIADVHSASFYVPYKSQDSASTVMTKTPKSRKRSAPAPSSDSSSRQVTEASKTRKKSRTASSHIRQECDMPTVDVPMVADSKTVATTATPLLLSTTAHRTARYRGRPRIYHSVTEKKENLKHRYQRCVLLQKEIEKHMNNLDGLAALIDWPEMQKPAAQILRLLSVVLNELAEKGATIPDKLILYLNKFPPSKLFALHNANNENGKRKRGRPVIYSTEREKKEAVKQRYREKKEAKEAKLRLSQSQSQSQSQTQTQNTSPLGLVLSSLPIHSTPIKAETNVQSRIIRPSSFDPMAHHIPIHAFPPVQDMREMIPFQIDRSLVKREFDTAI